MTAAANSTEYRVRWRRPNWQQGRWNSRHFDTAQGAATFVARVRSGRDWLRTATVEVDRRKVGPWSRDVNEGPR